jgi:hypothetical protein
MPFHFQQINSPCLLAWFFSIIIINEAWAMQKYWKKKKCGHMKVHEKKWGHILVHSRAKKLALLPYKEWRKNHCYGVIMIILLSHTCTPWSECMIFFSMDPLLTYQYLQCKCALLLSYLNST